LWGWDLLLGRGGFPAEDLERPLLRAQQDHVPLLETLPLDLAAVDGDAVVALEVDHLVLLTGPDHHRVLLGHEWVLDDHVAVGSPADEEGDARDAEAALGALECCRGEVHALRAGAVRASAVHRPSSWRGPSHRSIAREPCVRALPPPASGVGPGPGAGARFTRGAMNRAPTKQVSRTSSRRVTLELLRTG
jgi:hypothetical protein